MIRAAAISRRQEDCQMLSYRRALPWALGLVLLAGSSGCRCGARRGADPAGPAATSGTPVGVPAAAPASVPASAPELGSRRVIVSPPAEQDFVARMRGLVMGDDFARLWKEIPEFERKLDPSGKSAGALRGVVARSAGFLFTCQAVRSGPTGPCAKAAIIGKKAAAACKAQSMLFGTVLPGMAERRPCDEAMLTEVGSLMNVPAAEVKGLCEAVIASDPAKCPGPETALGVTCAALATGDPGRCGSKEDSTRVKGRSDCAPTVEAFKAFVAKKPPAATGHRALTFAAVKLGSPTVRCETEFHAHFKAEYARYLDPQNAPDAPPPGPPPRRGPVPSAPGD
jgi:hypothetical protein